ncbi:putative bifunctional diguanylate cyclase/phosphodiesterase [Lacimicrobium alkaliphilum]|uniref:Histidine kinase n=1 Tax=Lacimicrobium alkaliphilum TaxID=1526571 RepID=A0ABQ1RMP0_9ALTE|nr:EAL domain-containing protein [Lacimicrobium alkaliphilum]GGD73375.1 hypothetical protein GCM10011357_30580 [Lacimicrobium alkaliphilum]
MPSVNTNKLNTLQTNYKLHLAQYRARLTELWPKAAQDPEKRQEALTIAHRLAGSGQAYGFRDISQGAKELENALERVDKLSQKELISAVSHPFNTLLNILQQHEIAKDTLDEGTVTEGSFLTDTGNGPQQNINLLIVDDDKDFSARLLHTLETYGYRGKVESDIANLEHAVSIHDPLALLVDMDFYGHRFAGAKQVSLWRQKNGEPLPVIFISKHDSFELRLASVRAGGNHFLSKPLDIPKLVALLHSELNLAPAEPYRVIIVDDDRDLLSLYESILDDAGYVVSTATGAESALNLLDQSRPELILIDVNMPGCNGIELGRIIRQHEEFSVIPLLFISASANTDMELACARLTNDEFINKPIEPWRLVMMVKSRVVKGRQLRKQDHTLINADSAVAHDALTALPRLSHLRLAIDKTLQQKQQGFTALVKLDIRDFHTINNLHGKFFGDQILQRLAWELGQHIKSESLLCRENGDEFLIFTTGHDSRDALHEYINNMIKVIEEIEVISEQGQAVLSVDVGIAIAAKNDRAADKLIDHADMALFKAKAANGPELVYFDDSLQSEQKYRFNLEQAIKTGLNSGQFVAAYQPIFSVNEQTLVGFEALARWQHPERGLLGPGEFIPLMEERGLISQLTEQMLTHVALQLSSWQLQHPALFVSLNLSALDIQKPVFIEKLTSLITTYGLSADRIVLEITESLLLCDWQKASPVLESLRALGVRLALDDFGTGYSSLSYLHRINADKLKIDRSFIEHWSRTGDARLLKTMVQLGINMNMTVIAEGIERVEELDFLRQLGSEQYQGFLTARPMLLDELERDGWLLR